MKNNVIPLIISFLFISSIAFAQPSDYTLREVLHSINKDSLKSTVQDLQDFESRFCVNTVGQNKKAAQYLVDRLKAYNIEDARIDSFYITGYHGSVGDYAQYVYNVLGTLKGTDETDSTLIIGAHLDAISYDKDYLLTNTVPGADDNATGCAIMIEMARIIYKNNLKPRHNIDFMAYDAEEIGLVGAYYDAEKRKTQNENIIVMLNNDMVGNQPENESYKVTLHWYDNSLDVTEKARQALINYTKVTPFIPPAEQNGLKKNSDSWAYYQNNFKTTFAIEYYFSPYYHSVNDLAIHLNFDFCKEIAKMNFVLLAHYSGIYFKQDAISDYLGNSKVKLFPNPTAGELIIDNGELRVENVELYDIYGRKQKITINSPFSILHSIDISHLSSGIYFVRIYTEEGVINKKIIKQ